MTWLSLAVMKLTPKWERKRYTKDHNKIVSPISNPKLFLVFLKMSFWQSLITRVIPNYFQKKEAVALLLL